MQYVMVAWVKNRRHVTTIVWTLFIRLSNCQTKLLLYFVRKKGTMMHNIHNILENQDKDKSD